MSIDTIFQQVQDTAKNALSGVNKFIDDTYKVIVKPADTKGINGFVFDIPQETSLTKSKDITDHWTEDGQWVNDHAAKKPVEISMSGQVGELVDYLHKNTSFGKIGEAAGSLNNRLTAIGGTLGALGMDMSPQVVQTAQKILYDTQQVAKTADQIQHRAQNIVDAVRSVQKVGHQKEIYTELNALYEQDALLEVDTPWESFSNMAITELSVVEDEETQSITNISITLKEVRIAEIEITAFKGSIDVPRQQIQIAAESNNGQITGQQKDSQSWLHGVAKKVVSWFK
ncbi:hypothetical protein NO1_1935 [Candidatus Termititenax aidoneus]|uniref:Dit-like phage tail protein N-terminal domain-containing protein n=1 Tax=Termititenax aidoneus TaxID=2218524 RepID=A0A388TFH8_TERA1|nr:hypothetical protein NO1_1935 [Candidatus Termititenax aidoneus]